MVAIQISNIKKLVFEKMQSPKFVGIVIFVAVLFAFVQYTIISDEHRGLVEEYIHNSATVNEKIGLVEKIKLTKITSVGVNISDNNAYKEYFYTVDGESSRIRLVVVLSQKNGEYLVKIKNIKDANRWGNPFD